MGRSYRPRPELRLVRTDGLREARRVSETILYRTEALAVLEALSDLVVDIRAIRTMLEAYGEEEEEEDDLGE